MESKTIIAVSAVFFTLLAFILGCVSLALPSWWTVSLGGLDTSIGLFRSCVNILGFEVCTITDTSDSMFNAARWLFAIGVTLMGLALFLGLFLLCLKNACLSTSAMICDILGGVCSLVCICLFVYMSYYLNYQDHLGIGFILGIVCSVLAIIAGVMFGFAKPKRSGSEGRVMNAPM